MEEYDCKDDEWLKRLYGLREKWCPAYNKQFFSGGILSSQRSESTNSSLRKRLHATTTLVEFFHIFNDVVHEWRSNENTLNFKSGQGIPEMTLNDIPMLIQAANIYTPNMYTEFEKEYKRIHTYLHSQVESCDEYETYNVWHRVKPQYKYLVSFNKLSHDIQCTCMGFQETGILCSHSLRVYDLNCVEVMPTKYMTPRWTKSIRPQEDLENTTKKGVSTPPAVWRTQMKRKYNSVISASAENEEARKIIEDNLTQVKQQIQNEGLVVSESEDDQNQDVEEHHIDNETVVLNPKKSRQKGESNIRRKSTTEKMANIARGRKRAAETRKVNMLINLNFIAHHHTHIKHILC